MKLNDVTRIGVVGAGQMGRGICQVLATAGWEVPLIDISQPALDHAITKIREGTRKSVEKGTLPAHQAAGVPARIHPSQNLEDVREAQLVIEAMSEDPARKQELFARLGSLCPAETILASNTSSISISKLGSASGRPDRTVGIHFMNPVPVMPLVEIVRGKETAEDTVTLALEMATRLGKTPVVCQDAPGFIVNRILMPMINEAIYALDQGVASAHDIDRAMTAGTNHPMGPLALADRIGLDTVLAICEVMQHDFGNPKFRPCPLLRKYVEAGRLGRKSGQGFYSYEKDAKP